MRKRGEITVFLAMILLSMCALLWGSRNPYAQQAQGSFCAQP